MPTLRFDHILSWSKNQAKELDFGIQFWYSIFVSQNENGTTMVDCRQMSMREAAEFTAQTLGLEWKEVRSTYSELMENGYLPKSVGRNIQKAKPEYIARFLLGVFAGSSKLSATEANHLASASSPDGRKFRIDEFLAAGVLSPFLKKFTDILSDPDKAKEVAQVIFAIDEHLFCFVEKQTGHQEFRPTPDFHSPGPTEFEKDILEVVTRDVDRRSVARMLLQGEVLSELAANIEWA